MTLSPIFFFGICCDVIDQLETKVYLLVGLYRPIKKRDVLSFIAPFALCKYARTVGTKEIFYLTTHSTHFIYGYMASDIW